MLLSGDVQRIFKKKKKSCATVIQDEKFENGFKMRPLISTGWRWARFKR